MIAPKRRVTGGTMKPLVKPVVMPKPSPTTTKPRVTGGTAPVAGARSGVGRLAANQPRREGVVRQRLK